MIIYNRVLFLFLSMDFNYNIGNELKRSSLRSFFASFLKFRYNAANGGKENTMICEKCNKQTNISSMSKLCEKSYCEECLDEEKNEPLYQMSKDIDHLFLKIEEYNFPGILDAEKHPKYAFCVYTYQQENKKAKQQLSYIQDQNDQKLALQFSSLTANTEMVAAILKENQKLANKEVLHQTMFIAVKYGNKQLIQLLETYGADIKIKNKLGENLLSCAIREEKGEIIDYLIEKGVSLYDLNQINFDTPIDIAIFYQNEKILNILLSHCDKIKPEDIIKLKAARLKSIL